MLLTCPWPSPLPSCTQIMKIRLNEALDMQCPVDQLGEILMAYLPASVLDPTHVLLPTHWALEVSEVRGAAGLGWVSNAWLIMCEGVRR